MISDRITHWNTIGDHWRPHQKAPPGRCRKTAHASKEKAESSIRSLVKRNLHRPEEGDLRSYQCPRCLKWHTGHASSPALVNR